MGPAKDPNSPAGFLGIAFVAPRRKNHLPTMSREL
jgi:hypothetical protein